MKQRQLLNRKIDETLDAGWKKWSAQAAKLQVLWTDVENKQKDGKGFLKMDKTNISIVREDLEEDFRALADDHTRAITTTRWCSDSRPKKPWVLTPKPNRRPHRAKTMIPLN